MTRAFSVQSEAVDTLGRIRGDEIDQEFLYKRMINETVGIATQRGASISES